MNWIIFVNLFVIYVEDGFLEYLLFLHHTCAHICTMARLNNRRRATSVIDELGLDGWDQYLQISIKLLANFIIDR